MSSTEKLTNLGLTRRYQLNLILLHLFQSSLFFYWIFHKWIGISKILFIKPFLDKVAQKGNQFLPQSLIFSSLCLCTPMSYTFNISHYEFCQVKKCKFEISIIYTTLSGCKKIGITNFEFLAKTYLLQEKLLILFSRYSSKNVCRMNFNQIYEESYFISELNSPYLFSS